MLAKPERIVNERFLAHVRSLRCLICLNSSPDAHHLTSRGAGGSDWSAIPLCRLHHSEYHSLGLTAFQKKYGGINLWKESADIAVAYLTRKPEETS